MTKIHTTTQQALSLTDFTQELYQDLHLLYEKDSSVSGNLITVIVDSEYGDFKLNVAVQFDDNVESMKDRFDSLLDQEYEYRDYMGRWERDNYEHPSVTQGRAFDSLTC
ncbi:hypothetical protein DYBT9623_04446 [Dyadobacter sp. CECT 9623]|uniref:Uncharacterized protein n=1 Tax=Dyadobacter linearis TaxID=2823330 RepID=A0ABM8UVV1_9BACT|nr:hypothetical protein [Dyadobacter sp. CECT 9623]CAG5072909.1 hypothetical protein DYBT9623_04446 [Dyadobacter sp. CECT 9623]